MSETPNERHNRLVTDLITTLGTEITDQADGMVAIESLVYGALLLYFPNASYHGRVTALEALSEGVIERLGEKR